MYIQYQIFLQEVSLQLHYPNLFTFQVAVATSNYFSDLLDIADKHDLEIIITIIPTNNNAIPVSSKLFNAIDAVTREISVIHSDLNFSLITFRRSIKFSDVCIINSYCFNNIS